MATGSWFFSVLLLSKKKNYNESLNPLGFFVFFFLLSLLFLEFLIKCFSLEEL